MRDPRHGQTARQQPTGQSYRSCSHPPVLALPSPRPEALGIIDLPCIEQQPCMSNNVTGIPSGSPGWTPLYEMLARSWRGNTTWYFHSGPPRPHCIVPNWRLECTRQRQQRQQSAHTLELSSGDRRISSYRSAIVPTRRVKRERVGWVPSVRAGTQSVHRMTKGRTHYEPDSAAQSARASHIYRPTTVSP